MPTSQVSELSCRECAACCRSASDGTVLVSEGDLVRWKRQGETSILAGLVPGHFGQQGLPSRASGACVHLGLPDRPMDCSIYATRADTCRDFEAGSPQCLSYRRASGRFHD